jgi:UDP:flavonoid glycosyltransferase YjiC (YdhE family)
MRITLIAFGTRGDVSPFVALGARLRAGGHDVRLASHDEFEPLARQAGLDFHATPGSYFRIMDFPPGRFWSRLGVPRSTPLGLKALFNPFRDCAAEAYTQCWQACADADAIGSSPLASIIGRLIAQARDVPHAIASPIPTDGSRHFASPVFPQWPLGPVYNRATNFLGEQLLEHGAARVWDTWRREARRIAPAALKRPVREIALVAASPLVVPRPPDWPATTHITGFWFLPTETPGAVPDEVRAFVNAGPPPICLGFGSMAEEFPEELHTTVLNALARLKARAVVVGGSGGALAGLGNGDNVCEAAFVDYDWLFRNAAVVVHQGGAGTAAACLAGGVPQVILPYCLDHHFWEWRMREIGVAPRGIVRHRLSPSRLSDALRRTLEDSTFRRRASELAPKICAEDGLERAVEILSDHFADRPRGESIGVDRLRAATPVHRGPVDLHERVDDPLSASKVRHRLRTRRNVEIVDNHVPTV